MEFATIFNPGNLLFKHEVWYKGESDIIDSTGRCGKSYECRKAASFLTAKGADGFIQYQRAYRAFKGPLL